MMSRLPKFASVRLSPRALAALVAVLGMGFVAAVLIPGFELASKLANTTAALKLVGEQRRYPDLMRASLDLVRDRLDTHGYVEAPLEQMRAAVKSFEEAQGRMERAQPGGWFESSNDTAAFAQTGVSTHTAALRELWKAERQTLEPLIGFAGVPYRDDEASGTALNEGGRALMGEVNAAVRAARHHMPAIDAELAAIGSQLQAQNAHSALQLRIVMLAGLLIATVLVLAVTMLLGARARQSHSLREARQQTEDILRTVKDGLFLLDRNMAIGPTYSAALEKLFQRKDFAGTQIRATAARHRLRADFDDRREIRVDPLVGAHEREFGQVDQSAGRSGSPDLPWPGKRRYPLFGVRFPPGSRGRGDHPRTRVGGRYHRTGRIWRAN